MKNVVVLMGSPRKNGNSDILSNAFINGAEKAGNIVDKINVCDYNIQACIGCDYCKKNENQKCIHNDDMEKIYKRLAVADVIVVATPIYFYSLSSQLKKLIDRLHNPIRQCFNVEKLVLLAVCADTISTVFDSINTMYKSVLDYFNLTDGGIIEVFGVKDKGDIVGNPKLLEAESVGFKI